MTRNNKAFTLIELVVAMSIVLIISVIGTVRYFYSYDALKLDAAAQKIVSDIRYAQSLVINRNQQASALACYGGGAPYCLLVVDFSISQNCYHITPCIQNVVTCAGLSSDSTVTYAPITDPLTQQTLELNFDTSDEYKGVSISALAFGDIQTGMPAHAIAVFSPAGEIKGGFWFCFMGGSTATFAGVIDLPSTGGTITLSYRGKNKTIRISPGVGRITIE